MSHNVNILLFKPMFDLVKYLCINDQHHYNQIYDIIQNVINYAATVYKKPFIGNTYSRYLRILGKYTPL